MHENAFVALALWERVCHWVGRLRVVQAIVENGLVRGSRARCGSIERAGDHAEARGELPNVGFSTTMIVPGTPLRRYEGECAIGLVLVVESWSPVVGLIVRD